MTMILLFATTMRFVVGNLTENIGTVGDDTVVFYGVSDEGRWQLENCDDENESTLSR